MAEIASEIAQVPVVAQWLLLQSLQASSSVLLGGIFLTKFNDSPQDFLYPHETNLEFKQDQSKREKKEHRMLS